MLKAKTPWHSRWAARRVSVAGSGEGVQTQQHGGWGERAKLTGKGGFVLLGTEVTEIESSVGNILVWHGESITDLYAL